MGAAIREAGIPRRVPPWDLFRVLGSLRDPPFEPLRHVSFQIITYETFIITLASGRRGSKVHALSGLNRDASFEQDGSVSLRF